MQKAARFSPDQLRRIARRAIEAVEPDQKIVDAHENELLRTEEQAAREKCSLTLHDNGDGTTTGHFTIPALAAAILGKVIDAMTAPRRMRAAAADPVVRLAAPPWAGIRATPRAPSDRPPALKDRCHRGRHHRPHRPGWCPQSSPPGHRSEPLRWGSPTAGLHRRHLARGARQQVRGPRPRPNEPALLRVATGGQRPRTQHLRRHRLRTPLRLVRAPPPTTLGPRRPHRPRRRGPAVLTSTTAGSTTPATTTRPCPTATSDSAGGRDGRRRSLHRGLAGGLQPPGGMIRA